MQTLWIGTRKGLFPVRQEEGGWRIGQPSFIGEPVSQFAVDPRDGACYAALRLGHFGVKLWRSVDGGGTWKEVAAPAFPPNRIPTEPRSSVPTPVSTSAPCVLTAGLVMMLTTPFTALEPHMVAPGPRMTSMRSMSSRSRS